MLIAGLLLGGCAVQRFGASAMLMPPEGTELPIHVRAGLFLLPTHFAGDPEEHWLLLDTGTDRALLDVRLAAHHFWERADCKNFWRRTSIEN